MKEEENETKGQRQNRAEKYNCSQRKAMKKKSFQVQTKTAEDEHEELKQHFAREYALLEAGRHPFSRETATAERCDSTR